MPHGPSLRNTPARSPDGVRPLTLAAGAQAVERSITWVVERLAGGLLLAEILILLAGVVSRYVFAAPLTWTDELATTLFLWTVMLGAVVALRRGEHMRLVLGRKRLTAAWHARLSALAAVVTVLFAGLVLWPAWRHSLAQNLIETPALGISASWHAAALPVGFGLLLLLSLCRMAAMVRLSDLLFALVLAGGIGVALWFGKPVWLWMGNINLVVFFVLLCGGCVLAGVPIAFAFGIGTVAYLGVLTRVPLSIIVSRMDEGMSNLVLLAVPLFVFLGLLMEASGLARVLVGFLVALCGHVRGGLQFVLVGGMVLVSGISGAKAADMAAVAPILFPAMRRRGADDGEMIALLATSAAMSETIPPSLVLIMIGSVTGVSISALFTGGLLPALVTAAFLLVLAWWRSRGEDLSHVRRATRGEVGRALVASLPAMVLPFVIRAAVVDGVATATEVSTIGIVYCLLAGLLLQGRRFEWRRLGPILVETASLSGAILVIIGAATAMAWALTRSGFSQALVRLALATPGGAIGFLIASVVLFGVLGSVLEGIPVIVLFGPLLFPAARTLGINEVHYAMVAILAMGAGLFAPPFGVGFYAACAIGRVEPDAAVGRIWPYIGALLLALLLIAAVPWFSTVLL